jgi:predicted DNA-binding transcriptional regulator YafY
MPHPASRVLAMLELLQTFPRLTGADLAARLGVDERTVRRYATTLAELGIPVTAARGRYGGYRLSPGHRLPPLVLTDNEAVAVALGLVAADRFGLATEAPATGVALAKIHRLLPARLAARLAAAQEVLGFELPHRVAAARPASVPLLTLGAATREHRRVTVSYRSGQAAPSLREIDPYGLVFHAGRWYLTGYERRREEIATLRVEQIASVDLSEETFPVPEGFDPVGHVTRSLATVADRWEVEVLLETDATQARRRIPDAAAELTETADGVLLRIRADRLDSVAQLLAGLGCPFTIVRPDQLRRAVTDRAAQLTSYAQRRAPAAVS